MRHVSRCQLPVLAALGRALLVGEAPSVTELARVLALDSPSTVLNHLAALERKGMVWRPDRTVHRGWRLTLAGWRESGEALPVPRAVKVERVRACAFCCAATFAEHPAWLCRSLGRAA